MRLYRGYPIAIINAPLFRFGDTAANIGISNFQPICGTICADPTAIKIPAQAANPAAMIHVLMITLFTFIPVTIARSGLSEVARIDFPILVYCNI